VQPGAALTAMYMTRATYLTFFGEPRGASAGLHHHDGEHEEVDGEEHELELATVGAHPRSLSAAAAHGDEGSASDESHGAADGSGADVAGDHHDGDHHDGPHESGPLLLVPIVILAVFAAFVGLANATPLGEDWEQIKKYVEPRPTPVLVEEYLVEAGPGASLGVTVPRTDVLQAADVVQAEAAEGEKAVGCGFTTPEPGTVCFFPAVTHAEPKFAKILLSLGVVAAAYAVAIAFNVAYYGRKDKRLVGLTQRSRILGGGYRFLANKYYLDALYENVIVHAVAHPIAKATYWVNQHVIDRVVNESGVGTRKTAEWVYRNIDQRVVDGAVNASGTVTSETGHALQPVQSGKVGMYGALLFGAATVGAIVLVILNV